MSEDARKPIAEPKPTSASAKPVATSNLHIYKPSPSRFYLKMLVYGDPGVGKTTLMASADAVPEMTPALFVNVEGGTLALHDPKLYGTNKTIDTYDFSSFTALTELLKFLRSPDNKYKTVIIDSFSELCKLNLDHIVAQKIRAGGKNRDEDDIFLEDYGSMTKQMRRVMRWFRDLPMNVLLSAHGGPVQQDSKKVGPELTPKLRTSVIGMLDVLGYMHIGKAPEQTPQQKEKGVVPESPRQILFRPTQLFEAKDRTPGQSLGRIMVAPTMEKIMEQIRKNQGINQ